MGGTRQQLPGITWTTVWKTNNRVPGGVQMGGGGMVDKENQLGLRGVGARADTEGGSLSVSS